MSPQALIGIGILVVAAGVFLYMKWKKSHSLTSSPPASFSIGAVTGTRAGCLAMRKEFADAGRKAPC